MFADLQYMVVTDNTEIKPVIIAEINQGPAFAQPETQKEMTCWNITVLSLQ